jgi:hypothetical protein
VKTIDTRTSMHGSCACTLYLYLYLCFESNSVSSSSFSVVDCLLFRIQINNKNGYDILLVKQFVTNCIS